MSVFLFLEVGLDKVGLAYLKRFFIDFITRYYESMMGYATKVIKIFDSPYKI
jgi:hypothetical protein